jgi:hypothetical protein
MLSGRVRLDRVPFVNPVATIPLPVDRMSLKLSVCASHSALSLSYATTGLPV